MLSRVQLFETRWTIQSMEFSKPEYWSLYPFPSPGDLPNSGIKPRSRSLQVDSLPAEPQGKPKNTGVGSLSLLQQILATQESNRCLLHCRRILYQLSHQGSLPGGAAAAAVAKSLQSCPTLQPHRLYSPWDSPGQNTGVGSLFLLQRIFQTQESNRCLLHCRQILNHLSYQGSPKDA